MEHVVSLLIPNIILPVFSRKDRPNTPALHFELATSKRFANIPAGEIWGS